MTFINNLKGYRLIYANPAKKILEALPVEIAQRIYVKLGELVAGQSSLDIKKLSGYQDQRYRLRVGDYRIVYVVWKQQVIVYVIDIGHRKEIYRD